MTGTADIYRDLVIRLSQPSVYNSPIRVTSLALFMFFGIETLKLLLHCCFTSMVNILKVMSGR